LEEEKLSENRNKFYTNIALGSALSIFVCLAAYQFTHVVLEGKNYIASVNNRYVTVQDFQERIRSLKLQFGLQKNIDYKTEEGYKQFKEIEKQTIKELIIIKILMQNAEQEGIVVTDDMVTSEIDKIKAQSFKNSESEFRKALKKNSLTLESLRKMIGDGLKMQKYKEKLAAQNVKVTEKDLRDAYEKQKSTYITPESVEASHILVKDEKEANEIYKKLQAGADFAEMAKKSIDPGSKNSGGQLGYFSKGQMIPEFEKVAFALKIGEMSHPLKTNFGFHIIKKTGYKPESVRTFEEVRPNLEAQVNSEKGREFYSKFVQKAQEEAEIKYNPVYESYAMPDKPVEAKNNTDKEKAESEKK
jgi:parvulin-like peptidyl-prolyl isomerase